MKLNRVRDLFLTVSALTIAVLVSTGSPASAGDSASSSEKGNPSGAHGLRSAKDLPKPLPEVVEAVNKTAVEAGKELSQAGQVVKDAANRAYKNIKNGTSK
jgi:hypothetical protein